MSGVVRDFNKGHLNPQALQTHRKFRFIGQQLFNAAHANNPAETKDGYHELRLNHDVAVMLEVQVVTGTGRKKKKEWKHVWRLGNIVGMRVLKSKPKEKATESQLAAAEIFNLRPQSVSIQDPAAVFTVRWYHECNGHGDVLQGFQNKECKGLFYLPTAGEAFAEPVELVSNHAVLESVKMQKVLGHIGVWAAKPDHLTCVRAKFRKLIREAKNR